MPRKTRRWGKRGYRRREINMNVPGVTGSREGKRRRRRLFGATLERQPDLGAQIKSGKRDRRLP